MVLEICVRCGRKRKVGCDDISGHRILVAYTICEDCIKRAKEEIKKLIGEI